MVGSYSFPYLSICIDFGFTGKTLMVPWHGILNNLVNVFYLLVYNEIDEIP